MFEETTSSCFGDPPFLSSPVVGLLLTGVPPQSILVVSKMAEPIIPVHVLPVFRAMQLRKVVSEGLMH